MGCNLFIRKSSSEADTEEEDDSSDYSEELMPKKRKPVIPGERKSERERSRRDVSESSSDLLLALLYG